MLQSTRPITGHKTETFLHSDPVCNTLTVNTSPTYLNIHTSVVSSVSIVKLNLENKDKCIFKESNHIYIHIARK